jgi:hypothetical protein
MIEIVATVDAIGRYVEFDVGIARKGLLETVHLRRRDQAKTPITAADLPQ